MKNALGEAGPLRTAEGLNWSSVLGKAYAVSFGKSALRGERFGLFTSSGFRFATGRCTDCPVPEAALWYFRDELIAVPDGLRPITGTALFEPERNELPHPPLVWIGAPETVEHATLSEDGRFIRAPAGEIAFAVTPAIPTNRAYLDHATVAFLAKRPLRMRGVTLSHRGAPVFVARTIWPEDTRIDIAGARFEPLKERETLTTLIRAQTGGVTGTFAAWVLWERHLGQPRRWAGRPVLAFVLDGAQGDDDGAHGGHLAPATGILGPQGEWSDWLAANFYPIDDKNAKGILSAMVPMDNYLADLNSGQAWYRPNYMLVAVMRDSRIPRRVQAALQQVLHGYYCHVIGYDRASNNSTALVIDPLRWLGWHIPDTGPTGYLAAAAAFPVAALIQMSLSGGRDVFRMLAAEKTRLVPREAFEAIGHDLLDLVERSVPTRKLTSFERMLAADTEAVLFVRIPQIPSDRRFGTYPAGSLTELAGRVPWSRNEWETAPDPGEQPFPERLQGSCR
ncbi:uncharacterized protein sS8_0933 [Methylocaldum marinum]|uniref:Uncharacterized protein n=1 Tax=Methylocaldum marinum TaxID=1432792 RepID=A0A250KMT3_9GAMM|nr:hypothetical protein [Methylocaldum marinum]BBA32898.1 uncharacterized protein sS8_0933 [Methylocaldum marinum]